MKRFVEGEDRRQVPLPPCLDDYVTENNAVRVIEAFVDELGLVTLGFEGVVPEATGRPSYHPSTLLKIYLYGYLNRVRSSRRLEREAQSASWHSLLPSYCQAERITAPLIWLCRRTLGQLCRVLLFDL